MKHNYLKQLFTALLLLCTTIASAYDFEVSGIYYNILSKADKTVEVTNGSNFYTGSVVIPKSVIYNGTTYSVIRVGSYAFAGCNNLNSITIPNTVTTIYERAFLNCKGLTSIEIPNSVTAIQQYAFSDCTGLMKVEIPNSITSMGNYVFYGCINLGTVISFIAPEDLVAINSTVFNQVDKSYCKVYVPIGSKATYQAKGSYQRKPTCFGRRKDGLARNVDEVFGQAL